MLWLLLLPACHKHAPPVPAGPVVIPIVAMNDFHGALYEKPVADQPGKVAGGLPWLVGAVNALRAENPDLLLLDGGDSFQGDWPINASKGIGSVDAFALLGVDVTAVGNHEFDYGARADSGTGGAPGAGQTPPVADRRGALEAAAARRAQWVAANIWKDGVRWSPPGIVPWRIVERKGKKIGVIGLTTTETPQTTLAENVADLEFRDVVGTLKEVAPQVRAAGADVVIAVGHLTGTCKPVSYGDPGPDCIPDGEIGRILTELDPGTIDVLVAGHAHTVLAEHTNGVFVLEDRAQGGMLGRLDLVVGPGGVDHGASHLYPPWALIHDPTEPGCGGGDFPMAAIDVGGRTIAPDPAAVTLVSDLEAKAGGSPCTPIGCGGHAMFRDRTGESEVGDLVADAMLDAVPEADFAMQNAGGLRADLPAGEWRKEQAQAVMPFDNHIVVVKMTGAQVLDLFRIGSSGAHGLLQIAGAAYAYDPDRTKGTDRDGNGTVDDWERDRLCSATVGGAPVDPARTYTVATSNFLLGGGDHLGPAFAGVETVRVGGLIRDALVDHVRAAPACLGKDAPLEDPAHPRIQTAHCP
jgi:2',3'-cyclic-nucleotide 2'-phosphodiesterase (5'-nucleotidase family)